MSISQIKKEGKASLSGNWGVAIGVFLVAVLINGVLATTGIGSLFTSLVTYGLCAAFLSVVRTKAMRFENLFDSFKNLGPVFIANLLTMIFTFLWSLLFLIPGIVKSYSYAMTYYILADNPDMAPTDAITESRKMMDGNKWRLFCLDLSFIGWYLLSILTLGILALWISPYNMMARAEFYESLKPQPAVDDEAFVGGMAEETQNGDTTQL